MRREQALIVFGGKLGVDRQEDLLSVGRKFDCVFDPFPPLGIYACVLYKLVGGEELYLRSPTFAARLCISPMPL